MELLAQLTTFCWLYTWELSNFSNKFAVNLNMQGISIFTNSVDLCMTCMKYVRTMSHYDAWSSEEFLKTMERPWNIFLNRD